MIAVANPLGEYLLLKEEIDAAVNRVMQSGHYILGPEVSAFEEEFARYVGAKYAIGVGSGTEALHLALTAVGVGIGHEVITVSHTAAATISAIVLCGATPVFVDIDPETYVIDEKLIENKITERTKAIVPVHLYGNACNMSAIVSLAKKRNIAIVEDCCQAHGTRYHSQHVGTFGETGVFSFYPTKNLSAIGDGGIVITNVELLAKRIRALREYGWEQRYVSEHHGWNSRLDEMQAAILRVKLGNFQILLKRRLDIARNYLEEVRNLHVGLPKSSQDCDHSYHLFVIRSEQRQRLIEHLKSRSVGFSIHYPVPVHRQRAYSHFADAPLRITDKVAESILTIPLTASMSDEEVRFVVKSLNEFEG